METLVASPGLAPAAATWVTLYTVPPDKSFVGHLDVANWDAADTSYRWAIAVAGAADAAKQILGFDIFLPGLATIGHSGRSVKGGSGLTAGPGDLIRVRAAAATVSFNLAGVLNDALADAVPDFRVLNQKLLAGAGLEELYTSQDEALLKGVVFANQGADTTITLTRAVAGAADGNEQRIIYQETLFANDVFEWGVGKALGATDVLRADAGAVNQVSVNVLGWGVAQAAVVGPAPWANANAYVPPFSMQLTA